MGGREGGERLVSLFFLQTEERVKQESGAADVELDGEGVGSISGRRAASHTRMWFTLSSGGPSAGGPG